MKKHVSYFIVFSICLSLNYAFSQQPPPTDIPEVSPVFLEQALLPIKLSYSIRDLKKNTNDTTYMNSSLSYKMKDSWQDIDILLRARGNYRLDNCYFPPLKIKLKKAISKNTIFEGNKSMKLVLPCLSQRDKNDNVMREYLAYKIFELVSPYHFKTRLTEVTFEEQRGKKIKLHNHKGFLVEDDKTMAKRLNARVYDRKMHPLAQKPKACVRNAFFQYMIGNTDFSQTYSHNVKLLFIDKITLPVPYDFDMSGLVNTSYATVSVIQNEKLGISSVTERRYRGFARDPIFFKEVRQEFIEQKANIMSLFDSHEHLFENPNEFSQAKNYIAGFFKILENDKKFNQEILARARKGR